MIDHQYFTVSRTNAKPYKEGGKIAVHFSEAPKRNEQEGTTSYSMIFPGLLICEWVQDPESVANQVAEVLNENAHRFFESAPKPEAELSALREERDALRAALNVMVKEAVELAESGDAGFWDAEEVPSMIQARAALTTGEG